MLKLIPMNYSKFNDWIMPDVLLFVLSREILTVNIHFKKNKSKTQHSTGSDPDTQQKLEIDTQAKTF